MYVLDLGDTLQNTGGPFDSRLDELSRMFHLEVERRGGMKYRIHPVYCIIIRSILFATFSTPPREVIEFIP